jgi:predicted nucleic acid-binding protein
MFDTNILLSAMFSDAGKPFRAIQLAEDLGWDICTCRDIDQEAEEKFATKWPELLPAYRDFRAKAPFMLVPTPSDPTPTEGALRDVGDRPIYRAAAAAQVDYFVTGDKDFLEFAGSAITIVTATEFLDRHSPEATAWATGTPDPRTETLR